MKFFGGSKDVIKVILLLVIITFILFSTHRSDLVGEKKYIQYFAEKKISAKFWKTTAATAGSRKEETEKNMEEYDESFLEGPEYSKAIVAPEDVLIYAATSFFGSRIDEGFIDRCGNDIKNYCKFSTSLEDAKIANAVLFHARNIYEAPVEELSKMRDSKQLHIFWTLESPTNEVIDNLENSFNWTMSYKKESDIFFPYGVMIPSNQKNTVNYEEIWKWKTQETIWVVSNCNTANRRMEIIEHLKSNGFQVDMFGACTTKLEQCSKGEECLSKYMKPYKFGITLENSNCDDYVTEKFWRTLINYVIPIVLSRKYYRNLGIPDNVYIAIDDFNDSESFNEYIKNVSNSEELYTKFHTWRESFEVHSFISSLNLTLIPNDYGFCNLCEKLRKQNFAVKYYESMNFWHSNEKECNNTIWTSNI